jgi:hypothetical protein
VSSKRLYRVLRDLHLYLGLFLSPLILVFAASACALGIEGLSAANAPETSKRGILKLPAIRDSVALAKAVRRELELPGELGFVQNQIEEGRISFPLDRPGEKTQVKVDLRSGAYEWTRRATGLVDALIYLHKKPGPHNIALRGNWVPMERWDWLADATVYFLLFVSATGIYLWTVLRRERKLGLVLFGAGAVTFMASVVAVAA